MHSPNNEGEEKSLKTLGCPDGIATSGSCPDGYGLKTYRGSQELFQMVAMIVEGKHNSDSPLEGFPQAFASASNAGLAIIRKSRFHFGQLMGNR